MFQYTRLGYENMPKNPLMASCKLFTAAILDFFFALYLLAQHDIGAICHTAVPPSG